MTCYFVNRKKTVKVKNAKELIAWMRQYDLEETTNNQDFMEKYAQRKLAFEHIALNTSSEEDFVNSMVENGIIEIVLRKQRGILSFLINN